MEPATILICGGRDFHNEGILDLMLDILNDGRPVAKVVHGDARGADTLARKWAEKRGIQHTAYPADWKQFGAAAGKIRNRQMIKEPIDLVVAFPGGAGTQDMVNVAEEHRVRVLDYRDSLRFLDPDDDIPF